MNRTVVRMNAAGRGIQCPNCQTVYFLEGGKNRDRLYCWGDNGKQRWKLLCICGEQMTFRKSDVALHTATAAGLELGYAVQGEWKESSQLAKRSSEMLMAFSEAFGLSVQEFSQVILEETKKTEKRRH